MDKKTLRTQIREQKRAMTPEQIEKASQALAEQFLTLEVYRNAKTLYGYLPYNQEVRTVPILARALADIGRENLRGKGVVLRTYRPCVRHGHFIKHSLLGVDKACAESGSKTLEAAAGKIADVTFFNVDFQPAHSLNGINGKNYALFTAKSADFFKVGIKTCAVLNGRNEKHLCILIAQAEKLIRGENTVLCSQDTQIEALHIPGVEPWQHSGRIFKVNSHHIVAFFQLKSHGKVGNTLGSRMDESDVFSR